MQNITQPFEKGTFQSECWRIPAMWTTKNQTIIAAADARWAHGQDCPGNLETVTARSTDGGQTWKRQFVSHFEDVEDASPRCIFSVGCIDPVLAEDEGGRLYLLTDLCPPYVGGFCKGGIVCGQDGSGFYENRALALADWEATDRAGSTVFSEETYPYYVGAADEDGFCRVLQIKDGAWYRGYAVDSGYYLYQAAQTGWEPVMIAQLNGEGAPTDRQIHANVFFAASPLKVYPTFYLICRTSDDDGKTWSGMRIISNQVSVRGFTGICPGRGLSYRYEGKERILIAIYDNNLGTEYASVIYTEDRGETWHRGGRADRTGIRADGLACKTSESQLVELPDHRLRMYSRNIGQYISYEDSFDGGETWTDCIQEKGMEYCSNCMVSVIRYSQKREGKTVFLASYPAGDGMQYKRVNGVIAVGFADDATGNIDWKYHYPVNHAPYYYSCLTELPDHRIGLLYEYEEFAMRLEVYEFEELIH